jgi:hypothetical protein
VIKIPPWLSNRAKTPQDVFQRLIRKASGTSISFVVPQLAKADLVDLTTDEEISALGLKTTTTLGAIVEIDNRLYDGQVELIAVENVVAELRGKSSGAVEIETNEGASTVEVRIYTTYKATKAVRRLLRQSRSVELFGYAYHVASHGLLSSRTWMLFKDNRYKVLVAETLNMREYPRGLHSEKRFDILLNAIEVEVTREDVRKKIQNIFRRDIT